MSDIRLRVDLIMAQVELLKLKANDHDWAVYVPDDVKIIVNKTLDEIQTQLTILESSNKGE